MLIQGIKGSEKGMDAYLKNQFDFTGVKAALLVEQSILVILRDNKPDIPWPNTWGSCQVVEEKVKKHHLSVFNAKSGRSWDWL